MISNSTLGIWFLYLLSKKRDKNTSWKTDILIGAGVIVQTSKIKQIANRDLCSKLILLAKFCINLYIAKCDKDFFFFFAFSSM